MTEYDIAKTSGRCSISGRPFTEGETFYTVLFEASHGYERRDIAEECWQGPPSDAVCHFKAQLPRKEKPRKTYVDDEVLVGFFLRLADSDDAHKLRFRFVLSLILLRKRLLKYERTIRSEAGEVWEMRLVKDKTIHQVFHPSMDDAEIESLTRELGVILQGREPDEAADDVPAEPSSGKGVAD